ncbi:MAG: cell envelope integrity protein CreD [Bacteroidia bacterium]
MSFFEKISSWARRSITLKLITIGILILILLIPSSMLTSLIYERETTRDNATNEVSSKWGDSQTIGGPVISIPYQSYIKTEDGKTESTTQYAHFLPNDLEIKGTIVPEKRYRGIYVVVLYNSQIEIKGKFSGPDFKLLNISPEALQLNKAIISLGITDMKGIKEQINFVTKDSSYSFSPGIVTNDIFNSGVSAPIDLTITKGIIEFSLKLDVNGSQKIYFLPFGKETNVEISSTWNNPSFEGDFLPDERKVEAEGFSAKWKILHLNRNYPQQGLGSFINKEHSADHIDYDNYYYKGSIRESAFGVRLLLPVDEYQKTNRSAKYNVMFIIITFITFFFVEVLNKKRLHPIQYLLVGFSICLFYVLLLSLSEHISFDFSYLISSIIILILITFYSKSILKSNFLTGLVGMILFILYGFFYSLLQMQDYALLLGSAGLLIILATIMYLTRKIDWYSLSSDKEEENNT